ncbi:MAG: Hsp20/alpha crystallin family protein [Phycisphaeraceae bacterium]|nr:Hsp20/alpha crystallin family protein [Phycisphaeraceae bacterium]
MTTLSRLSRTSPMAKVIDEFMAEPFFFAAPVSALGANTEGNLALDVSEDEQHYIVRASLPGYQKDQVEISAHNGLLSIRAQRSEEHEEKGERFLRRERRFGSVQRVVSLPGEVDEDKIVAELKEGELVVRLPKTPKNTPRRISVN